MPQLTLRTTPNRSSNGSRTFAQIHSKLPISYNGMPHILPQKLPPPMDRSQTQLLASSLDPSDLPSQNCIHMRSAVLPQCTGQTDRHPHTQTNRYKEWWHSLKSCNINLLHYNIKHIISHTCNFSNWDTNPNPLYLWITLVMILCSRSLAQLHFDLWLNIRKFGLDLRLSTPEELWKQKVKVKGHSVQKLE